MCSSSGGRPGRGAGPGAHTRDAARRARPGTARSDLTLAYWLSDQQRYVDAAGRPVHVPADPGDGKTTTVVAHDGRRVAALVHDASLSDEPELVRAACAAAGLALENERLQAELRARVAELRASRARLVEAADAERRRLERNLHDGTQQRLVSVSMALGLAESTLDSDPAGARRIVAQARSSLGAALAQLRELSQGIHPGILTERGLGQALQELTYTAPVPVTLAVSLPRRLPEAVETALYYVAAEALANVAKHAAATAASVTVRGGGDQVVAEVCDDGTGGADPAGGTGLRGLSDRVEAPGGSLTIDSPPGKGTRLRVQVPCGS